MKKFYPNKDWMLTGIFWLVLGIFSCVGILMLTEYYYWGIFIPLILFLLGVPTYFLVIGSLSIRFKEDCLIYKKTCFSKKKENFIARYLWSGIRLFTQPLSRDTNPRGRREKISMLDGFLLGKRAAVFISKRDFLR